jgi:hypothetical protein
MYGTKKIVKAVLYLVPVSRFNSLLSPRMAALLILTLRKSYKCQLSGAKPQHGIAMSLPVQKGKQVQDTQARQQVRIDLGHQLAFIDIMNLRSFRVRRLIIFWRVGERTLALLTGVELCSRELSAPVSRVQSQALHGYGLNRIIPATPMIGCDR